MTTRLLPPEEWPRLVGTEAEHLWPHLNPQTARIVVVERDGVIVGCHVLMTVLHAECLWIAPAYRGAASVGRRLWTAVQEEARRDGVAAVMTQADSDPVRRLIARAGGVRVTGDPYMVPVASANERHDLAIGRAFHRQLSALADPPHADDVAHDLAVGRALRQVIADGGAPETAVAEYNAWATRAGYAPIQYLGLRDGAWLLNIVSAVIAIDRAYHVTLIEERSLECP